jgi:hypothetical protein
MIAGPLTDPDVEMVANQICPERAIWAEQLKQVSLIEE